MSTIQLRRPFPLLDKTMCEVVRPRDYLEVGDFLAARRESQDEAVQTAVLVARVCGLELSEIQSMDMRDYLQVVEHVAKLQESEDPKAETG